MIWTMRINSHMRRSAAGAGLALFTGLLILAAQVTPARAEALSDSHVLSTFGSHKYGPDFEHFDYVNPNAPKGGRIRVSGFGSFDSLNPFIVKGTPAGHVFLIYESLFEAAYDEPLVSYGLIAERVSYPADYSSATYTLRAEARWHDGMPITVEDVIFSFESLKKAHPRYAYYYKNVVKAEKTGERQVTFTFDEKGNRELPDITAQLTILPKHFWEGTDAEGNKRDIMASSLEPPLGSGPYRVKEVKPGSSLTLERAPDFWSKDLNVNVGRHNFDEIHVVYFRDQTVMFEAFKADHLDVRVENQAKRWATGYDFDAVKEGRVVQQVFKDKNPEAMSAFVFNMRRAKFADPRVRLAFNYAFDFEWTNRNIFFDQYTRTSSYFVKSELAHSGVPEGLELEILDDLRGQVPEEVFTTEFSNPSHAEKGAGRKNMRTALKLFKEAGWVTREGALVNAETGERMSAEFLIRSPDSERIVLPYKQTLERLGIEVTLRAVDTSQYRRRTDTFDFDIVMSGWGQSLSPGNEQRDFWGSISADREGSRNLGGIKDAAIDKLIDRIILSKNREEQLAATRALDRVLLWNHFVVPNWYFDGVRVARWDRFGIPQVHPDYGFSYLSTWWFDTDKVRALEAK